MGWMKKRGIKGGKSVEQIRSQGPGIWATGEFDNMQPFFPFSTSKYTHAKGHILAIEWQGRDFRDDEYRE